MHDHVFVFPDTNILLHFPPIADLDWCKLCDAKTVTLVFCITVVEELDAKKSDSRLGSRAARAIKDIREAAKSGGSVRANVSLTIFNKPFRRDEYDGKLSPDSNDDRIIHFAKLHGVENLAQPYAVITEDFGMELRCEANGVNVVRIDSSNRLDDPVDELTRKNRQLQVELNEVKNRQPKFSVSALSVGSHFAKPNQIFEAVIERLWHTLDVEVQVAVQENKLPKLRSPRTQVFGHEMLVASAFYDEDAAREYNEKLDRYFAHYRRYVLQMNKWNEQKARCIEFDLWLTNEGSAPGSDIDAYISFPDAIESLADHESQEIETLFLLHGPAAPDPPKKPERLDLIARAESHIRNFDFPYITPISEQIGNMMELKVRSVTVGSNSAGHRVIHARAKNLKHGTSWKLGSFIGLFNDWNVVKPFPAECSFTAAELPKALESTIIFKIEVREPS